MFKVKGQRSKSQGQRSSSRRKVMYQQQKRYNTATDRFSDVKLGMASQLKRERADMARAASSCNALAFATFSSYFFLLSKNSFRSYSVFFL